MSKALRQTVGTLLRTAAARLQSSSPSPEIDAELLLLHALGWPRIRLFTDAGAPLDHERIAAIDELLERRVAGEPVAYILGSRGFWTLDLDVDARVLIPRPETELVVERALALTSADSALAVADLGTGSGAIALALASERPHWHIFATDQSCDALAVAGANAERLGLRVEWRRSRQGTWFAPLTERHFHLIVSNPPYVAAGDHHLQAGDCRFEPASALASGEDGLSDIRSIIRDAPEHLAAGGWLILEHGYDQGAAVAHLMRQRGFRDVQGHRDLGGQDRVTEGRIG